MKKIVGTLVLVVMLVTVLCVSAGCSMGNSDQQAEIDALRQSIESLVAENSDLSDRVEDLENKNNVFWTEKAEYSDNETMTVFFKDTKVFDVSIDHSDPFQGNGRFINGRLIIKSYLSDMYADSVLGFSFIKWKNSAGEFGSCTRDSYDSYDSVICYMNQEVECPISFDATETLEKGESFYFALCVPGTTFELAHFNINII